MVKKNEEQIPDIEIDGWNAEQLAKEAANEEPDDIVRKIRRGKETVENLDKSDETGVPGFEGLKNEREQSKKN